MLAFLGEHAQIINAISSLLMVAIWVVYLQLFFVTYRQQKRSAILIDRGVARDENARCIVTNMGQEPIYLLAVAVDFGQGDGISHAVVTDRDEVTASQVSVPLERTNQGPLGQGEARDVGSLADLMKRAHSRHHAEIELHEIREMWVSAVAISNQGEHLVAAQKGFAARHLSDGKTVFEPESTMTKQIRSRWRRRKLLALLEDDGAR